MDIKNRGHFIMDKHIKSLGCTPELIGYCTSVILQLEKQIKEKYFFKKEQRPDERLT